MVFLLLALFFSSCIFFTFKFFDRFKINILPAVAVNYLLAAVLGYLSCRTTTTVTQLFTKPWVLISILTGMSFVLTFVVFAVSTRRVGVAMTVVSGKMSIVLSVVAGFWLLSEPFGTTKVLGILAAMLAFYLTNKGRSEVHVDRKFLYLPVLIFVGTGANDILMKLSGVYYPDRNEIQFLTITFFTAFVIGVLLVVRELYRKSLTVSWRDLAAGVLLGVFNWYSTYFFIKGLFVLPISLFIPVFNAALVFIAAFSGYLFLNEKLSVLNRIGIALALLAIAVIAFF